MKNIETKHYYTYIKIAFIFLLLCVFFYFVPYTDDDLRWGSATGIKRLTSGFDNYGGRYLGYLIVMGLTRSELFKTLFMSTIIMITTYLVRYITNLKIAPGIVILSIMAAPLSLFSSTIGWVSGFSNYVTSVCFTLVYIAYIVYFEKKETKQQSFLLTIPMILLGMVNTLIVEHYTIYNVLLGLFMILSYVYRYKRVFVQFVGFSIGSIAGAIWMFSNSAYHNVLSGDDSYRYIRFDEIVRSMGTGLVNICRYGYLVNVILNVAILILLCSIVVKCKQHLNAKQQSIVKSCLFMHIIYIMASIFLNKAFNGQSSAGRYIFSIVIVLSLLSILSLGVISFIFAKQYDSFQKILFLLISIVIINAPFIIINPVTPRVFFGTYILFAIILCILLELTCREIQNFPTKEILHFCNVALIIGTCFYITIFVSISKADQDRLQDIRNQIDNGKKKVILYPIPHEQFVHDINVSEKWELNGYKHFYDLPDNIKLVIGEKKE